MEKYINVIPYIQETALNIHALYKEFGEDCAIAKTLEVALRRLSQVPAVEVMPVRHAHWEPIKSRFTDGTQDNYTCSGCSKATGQEYDYCPNCGAKMDEEVE